MGPVQGKSWPGRDGSGVASGPAPDSPHTFAIARSPDPSSSEPKRGLEAHQATSGRGPSGETHGSGARRGPENWGGGHADLLGSPQGLGSRPLEPNSIGPTLIAHGSIQHHSPGSSSEGLRPTSRTAPPRARALGFASARLGAQRRTSIASARAVALDSPTSRSTMARANSKAVPGPWLVIT